MFLHGVETIEQDGGLRTISLLDSSTIGLIGTAPQALPATAASITLGSAFEDSDFNVTANALGTTGNAISIRMSLPATASQPLAVTVSGNEITVSLATDVSGEVDSTAAAVVAELNADAASSALITAELVGTGSGFARRTQAARPLAGGTAEPFPLNKPILISGSLTEASGLGDTGTIPEALDAIFDQAGARVVVVRVAEGVDDAGTTANVIGGSSGGILTGLQAFLNSQAEVKVRPRVLIAPYFSHKLEVLSDMIGIAEKLRAVIIADGPNTTDADAITYRENFGSDRLMLVDPWVRVFDTVTQEEKDQPASARVAGVIVKTDYDRGFWWSPSNKTINGILGSSRPISFGLSDPLSRSNYLNENEVTTIIQQDGWRVWGNRSSTDDPLWTFLAVRRTADVVEDSIEAAHLWAIDRPFSVQLLVDIRDSVDAFLRSLIAQGALLGGQAAIDLDKNTKTTLAAGQLFISYDMEPPAPLERLTFHAYRNGDYYEDLIAQVVSET